MDVSLPFLFDAVVTHVEVFGVEFTEPLQLMVKLKFMGNTLKLTSSRVNVSDFVANREYEFLSEPETVRSRLEEVGVELAVVYQGSTLGIATVTFPTVFLGKISPTMNDLLLEETLNLQRRAAVVGSISILFRLTLKCEQAPMIPESPDAPEEPQRKASRISISDQAPTINPQDFLFLMGDPDPLLKIPSDPCTEPSAEEGDERLCLDLQRYRSLNRRVTFPRDDPCLEQKPSFSRLKKLTKEYSEIIDSVAKKINQMDCRDSLGATPTSTPSPRTPKEERQILVPLRSEPEDVPGVKPIRYCPVCLYSMSWLPKYLPCPRCNTKATPVLPRPSSKEQLRAMQIVAEQLVRPKVPQEDDEFCLGPCTSQVRNRSSEGDECAPCRCTCTKTTICAHCRVRRMCEEIYKGVLVPPPPKRAPNPGPGEDFCVIAETEPDDPPYLSRVFHEMKYLYELHDSRKLSAQNLVCQSQTLLPKRSIKELTEALYQGGSFRSRMEHHSKKTGHKRCLPSENAVSRRHGWNWTTSQEARTKGWRPGAILRTSGQVMRYFLMYRERNLATCQKILCDEDRRQRMAKPLLCICKRNGEIFVTLRPLGKSQKPITFRIVKSQLALALRQIKRALKEQGFEKCTCHKSLMLCTCRSALEKLELNKALRRECRRRFIKPCPEQLVLTDTSVSDLEFNLDVHPPSKSFRSRIKAIRNSVNHGTQTSKADMLPPPPQYPMKVSPHYQAFDCAVGDRYMGTAFGWPGEEVFEDGVFGLAGGGPHGPNPMPCGVTRPATAWGAGGGGGMFTSRGRRQGARGGPGGGPGGAGWKGFPCQKDGKGRRGGISGPIPVRYPKRFLKLAQVATKAAKEAEKAAAGKKKKGR